MATIAYGHAFKNHLQDDDPMTASKRLMLPTEMRRGSARQKNVPIAILHIIGRPPRHGARGGLDSEGATIVLEAPSPTSPTSRAAASGSRTRRSPSTYASSAAPS